MRYKTAIIMKTIALLGGTGWISTIEYYRLINMHINGRLGGLNSAKCLLYSFNYAEIDELNKQNNPKAIFDSVLEAAMKLERAGGEVLLLCANTLHQYADELKTKINIPILHIADAVSSYIIEKNLNTIGLLGTKYTMEMDFYTSILKENKIDVIVPEKSQRDYIHSLILDELLKNVFSKDSKRKVISIMNDLINKGAEGIVLGCTEIPLLINQNDFDLPLINTLEIHALAAVDYALSK